jgi:hypothetical protein
MRLATEEDLLRAFGPDKPLIGCPVRPKPEDEQPQADESEDTEG